MKVQIYSVNNSIVYISNTHQCFLMRKNKISWDNFSIKIQLLLDNVIDIFIIKKYLLILTDNNRVHTLSFETDKINVQTMFDYFYDNNIRIKKIISKKIILSDNNILYVSVDKNNWNSINLSPEIIIKCYDMYDYNKLFIISIDDNKKILRCIDYDTLDSKIITTQPINFMIKVFLIRSGLHAGNIYCNINGDIYTLNKIYDAMTDINIIKVDGVNIAKNGVTNIFNKPPSIYTYLKIDNNYYGYGSKSHCSNASYLFDKSMIRSTIKLLFDAKKIVIKDKINNAQYIVYYNTSYHYYNEYSFYDSIFSVEFKFDKKIVKILNDDILIIIFSDNTCYSMLEFCKTLNFIDSDNQINKKCYDDTDLIFPTTTNSYSRKKYTLCRIYLLTDINIISASKKIKSARVI